MSKVVAILALLVSFNANAVLIQAGGNLFDVTFHEQRSSGGFFSSSGTDLFPWFMPGGVGGADELAVIAAQMYGLFNGNSFMWGGLDTYCIANGCGPVLPISSSGPPTSTSEFINFLTWNERDGVAFFTDDAMEQYPILTATLVVPSPAVIPLMLLGLVLLRRVR